MADLDALVRGARAATIRREVASAYVRDLDRWAVPAPRVWPAWGVAGLAMAAAIAVYVGTRPQPLAPTALRIGDRVAIVAEPGTEYRVVEASAAATTIEVEHGTVTARLWPGAAPHHLVLAGGGVTASAHGTVYELAVSSGHASVHVAEGTVEVAEHGEVHRVTAGTAWRGAELLLAMPAPPVVIVPEPPVAAVDPSPPPAPIVVAPAPPRKIAAPPDAAPSIKDRWRDARLLRGQGHFAEALQACLAIADARDATWSPIALVEAVRIAIGPLADPEQAIALAERAIREWPSDALVGEARALRCQALDQLGRASDCKRP